MNQDLHARFHAHFSALHRSGSPLLLPNAWDAASARLWQEAGAAAVATSSAAVAWSLGYADEGALPRAELLGLLRNIVRVTSLPITLDIEDGYSGDPRQVAQLAAEVAAAGAIGINIEDGDKAPELLVAKLRAIREALGGTPLFINARCDIYVRGLAAGGEAVSMSIERLNAYRAAGADGGFLPGLCSAEEAAAIASAVPLAINLMAMPGLPTLEALAAAGVRRISAGPALFKCAYGAGEAAVRAYLAGDFAPAFAQALDYGRMNRLFSPD
jgi:2-methylisocitrate lyase-like PEP mutase family enzyme